MPSLKAPVISFKIVRMNLYIAILPIDFTKPPTAPAALCAPFASALNGAALILNFILAMPQRALPTFPATAPKSFREISALVDSSPIDLNKSLRRSSAALFLGIKAPLDAGGPTPPSASGKAGKGTSGTSGIFLPAVSASLLISSAILDIPLALTPDSCFSCETSVLRPGFWPASASLVTAFAILSSLFMPSLLIFAAATLNSFIPFKEFLSLVSAVFAPLADASIFISKLSMLGLATI